jgi:hypothetical protein
MTKAIKAVCLSQESPYYFPSTGAVQYETTLRVFFADSSTQQIVILSSNKLNFHENTTPGQFLDLAEDRYDHGSDSSNPCMTSQKTDYVLGIDELPSMRERIDEITRMWALTRINKMENQIAALKRRFLS